MATARVHITKALQYLSVLPVGVLPSTTDDEPDCLIALNNLLDRWSEVRKRADLEAKRMLAGVMEACAKGAEIALTGSSARTALENAAAAAASGYSIAPITALTTYALVTTDNSYNTGFDDAIQKNLAVAIAPIYKRTPSDALVADAQAAYAAIMPQLTPAQTE